MINNPFQFDAAPNLKPRQLIDWYIEDNNYSRFMQSPRNIVVNGERGSGKSMMLIYHSLKFALEKYGSFEELRKQTDKIGIYIPCNTPLSSKEEHKFFEDSVQARISEANLALSVLSALARQLKIIEDKLSAHDRTTLSREFRDLFEISSVDGQTDDRPFSLLEVEARRRNRIIQTKLMDEEFDKNLSVDSFLSIVAPVLSELSSSYSLKDVHFSLLIDDIQMLNNYQKKLVNSWLAYRDNSIFSLKLSVAGIHGYDFSTSHGSAVLEGHDYISIDLQRPIQNNDSEFGKFAAAVVEQRLRNVGIKVAPKDFFPVHESVAKGLKKAKKEAMNLATEKGYEPDTKKYRDFVYKQYRVFYFRTRDPKANKPPYSGFETLTHLSTGVIRNLLQPCFYMFDQQVSNTNKPSSTISKIDSHVQNDVIQAESNKLWDTVRSNLENRIPHCTKEDAERLYRMLTKVAEYFRERLLHHDSEPRVLTFIVSERKGTDWSNVEHLLRLAESAQIMYRRSGTAKKGGGREVYYVPNRFLWPQYGLDTHGQHGRASLKASELWAAAISGKSISLNQADDDNEPVQEGLF